MVGFALWRRRANPLELRNEPDFPEAAIADERSGTCFNGKVGNLGNTLNRCGRGENGCRIQSRRIKPLGLNKIGKKKSILLYHGMCFFL